MVRFVIAIACVSVVMSSATVVAQTKAPKAKMPVAGNLVPRESSGKASLKPAAIKPVANSRELAPAAAAANVAAAAESETEDDILNQKAPEMPPELVRELDHLMLQWSESSDKVERLEGKHFRIVYDNLFEVEKQSEGEFAYEKADKGRIDITPVQVTPQLLAARKKEIEAAKAENRPSQVKTKVKTGEPFELAQEQPERWSCDGQRVYSLDIEKKEAVVAQLPADQQGKNIMDSPLPFLFGMSPEKARQRFTIFFSGSKFNPASGRANLTIYPREAKDAQAWRQAEVILDLKELLPVAVKLTDPAGTKVTVYKFKELHKNKKSLPLFLGSKNQFTPDLRDFNVQTLDSDSPPELADARKPEGAPGDNGLANVTGMSHSDAVKQLERQGLTREKDPKVNQIVLEQGPVATRTEDVYTVKSMDPPAGTSLKPGMKVKLVIWTKAPERTASK